jgi:hypothetical protein
MKALRFHGVKYLRVEEVPGPKACGAHQVLVQNSYCGICGTDLHEYLPGPIQILQKPHPFSKAVLPGNCQTRRRRTNGTSGIPWFGARVLGYGGPRVAR